MEKKKKPQDLKKTEDLDKAGLEQKVKDLEFEKKFLIEKFEESEVKILKKKEKIQNLRILIEESKEKLGQFNDRDLQSMHLLKMKEKQMYSLFFKTFFENKIIFFKKLNLIFKARMPGPIFSKKRPNTCKRSKTPKPSSKKRMPKSKRSQMKTATFI